MTSHDVICVSEFVLFNNTIIFVLSFSKIAKLLISSMIWVEATKGSLILVFAKRQNVVLDDYGMSFAIKHWCLASISRLLKHIDN